MISKRTRTRREPGRAELEATGGHQLQTGQHAAAEITFRKVTRLAPQYPDGYGRLAAALFGQRKLPEARTAIQQAIKLDGNRAQFHAMDCTIHGAAQRQEEALKAGRRAVAIAPQDPEVARTVARAYRECGALESSIELFEQSLALQPDSANSKLGLATSLIELGEFDRATEILNESLADNPNDVGSLATRGNAHRERGDHQSAVDDYERALELQPDLIPLLSNYAITLRELGRVEDAVAAFRRALVIAPDHGPTRLMLAWTQPYKERDAELAWLEKCAKAPGKFGVEKHDVWFALARIHEQLGDREAAVQWVLRANKAKRQSITFDFTTEADRFAQIRAAYNREALANIDANSGLQDDTPIFVVGLPRSGTTLVEQILGAHAQIEGAGELEDLPRLIKDATSFAEATPDTVTEVAQEYLRHLRMRAPGARHIVDKLPANFQLIGAIRKLFPKAKIVHCVRDLRDTCASIFRTQFHGHMPWSFEQTELGRYALQYQELMQHWRTAVSEQVLLDLPYEDLVNDFETGAKRLIDFIGLPWDPACLRFHERDRVVRTLSQTQVRQPIYRSSVGNWQDYSKAFVKLFETLDAPTTA